MPRRDDEVVEGLPRLGFTTPRSVTVELRDHLRRLVMDAHLAPGQVLKQAQLARVFGVSRTPMREAFRMLQEEGLIEAETNQRARVRDLDAAEVDQLYSARILLESLGARLTAGDIRPDELARATTLLELMDQANDSGDMDRWIVAHREFHRLCVIRAGEPLVRVIESYSERCERYLRQYRSRHPNAFADAHDEHGGILSAVVAGDRDLAGARMATHLARSGASFLADIPAGAPGSAIAEAVAMARVRVHRAAADARPRRSIIA